MLAETLADFDNVRVTNADIMQLDIAEFVRDRFGGRRITVCANLPYYITTPVIMALLESGAPIDRITVMVQKEVRCSPRRRSRQLGIRSGDRCGRMVRVRGAAV